MTPLTLNTLLLHYRIEQVLGIGGFGVTYLARDEQLGKLFAIKEYFPADFAARDKGKTVRAKADSVDNFLWGKERFLEEARVLARFQHPNIVGISRIFDANGTAYIVQEYQSGRSFKEWVSELESPPSQVELDLLVSPILSALEVIHRNDVLHRDIAPDNIYIRDDGSPVLLDFGSAREAVAQRTKTMSAVVKSGYSPPEQYSTKGKSQGAWSDIYALAATLYWAVTGKAPEEATDRILEDDLVPATKAAKGAYRTSFLEAIDHALKLSPSERPRSIEAWRPALLGSLKIDAATPASQPEAWRPAPLGSLEIDAATPASQRKPEAQSGLQGGPLTAGPQTPARSNWRSPLIALSVLAVLVASFLYLAALSSQMSGSNTAIEQRAAEQRAAEQIAAEQRAAEQRIAEQRAAEQRAAEQRTAEQRASERAAEQRSAEFRAAQRAAEQRAAEQRAAEQRAMEQRAAQQREAEQRAAIQPTTPLTPQQITVAPSIAPAVPPAPAPTLSPPQEISVATLAPTQTLPPAAALSRPEAAPAPATRSAPTTRQIFLELRRVGCASGEPPTGWNNERVRSALRRYASVTGTNIPALPTTELLDALRAAPGRVCPAEAARPSRARAQPVSTTPPARRTTVAAPTAPRVQSAPAASNRSPSNGRRCFIASGLQFCE
jgi:serine/threonine protein kinase